MCMSVGGCHTQAVLALLDTVSRVKILMMQPGAIKRGS
jgi:hypothetical protein